MTQSHLAATHAANRYQLKRPQAVSGLERVRERAWDALSGPVERPGLAARAGVTVASVLFAAALTTAEWNATGHIYIEFYLLACVIATWYGGLAMGLLAVAVVSVLQFNGAMLPWADWEVDRPASWVRMFILAGAAVAIAMLWDALQRKKAKLAAAISDLQTVIDLVPAAIAIAEEPSCQYIRINPLMAKLMNVEPGIIASVTGPAGEQPTNFVFCRDGAPVPADELPVQMAASTQRPTPREELEIARDDGTTVHIVARRCRSSTRTGTFAGR